MKHVEHEQGKAKVTSNEQVKVKSEKASEQVDSITLYVKWKGQASSKTGDAGMEEAKSKMCIFEVLSL